MFDKAAMLILIWMLSSAGLVAAQSAHNAGNVVVGEEYDESSGTWFKRSFVVSVENEVPGTERVFIRGQSDDVPPLVTFDYSETEVGTLQHLLRKGLALAEAARHEKADFDAALGCFPSVPNPPCEADGFPQTTNQMGLRFVSSQQATFTDVVVSVREMKNDGKTVAIYLRPRAIRKLLDVLGAIKPALMRVRENVAPVVATPSLMERFDEELERQLEDRLQPRTLPPSRPTTMICPLDWAAVEQEPGPRLDMFTELAPRLDGRRIGHPASRYTPHLPVCPLSPAELERLRDFVSSPMYREALAEPEGFYRLARIYEYLGKPAEQIADAYLYASWQTPYDDVSLHIRESVLDPRDVKDRLAAQAHYLWYVEQALFFYPAALKEGGRSAPKALDLQFKCVELSRLVGRFGQAERYLKELQRTQRHRPTHFNELLKYEAQLIRERDTEHHHVSHATTANKSSLAYSPGRSR